MKLIDKFDSLFDSVIKDNINLTLNKIKSLGDNFILCDTYGDNFLVIINNNKSKFIKLENESFFIDDFTVSRQRMEIACNQNNIFIFDVYGNIKDKIEYSCLAETFSYDRSGKYLFIFYKDFMLKIYDLDKKVFVKSSKFDFLEYDEHASYYINFSKDNDYIIIKSSDKINIITEKTEMLSIKINSSYLELSNNSKYFVSCYISNSEDIHIFNTDTWSLERVITGIDEENKYLNYHDDILSVSFSPDDRYIIGCYIGAIKIFDFETGNKIYESREFYSQNVAFSEDGKLICFNDGKGLKLFEFSFK